MGDPGHARTPFPLLEELYSVLCGKCEGPHTPEHRNGFPVPAVFPEEPLLVVCDLRCDVTAPEGPLRESSSFELGQVVPGADESLAAEPLLETVDVRRRAELWE